MHQYIVPCHLFKQFGNPLSPRTGEALDGGQRQERIMSVSAVSLLRPVRRDQPKKRDSAGNGKKNPTAFVTLTIRSERHPLDASTTR